MEVNIKYKEQDKKAEVRKLLLQRQPVREIVSAIDAIYKEDSKQIDSARIQLNDMHYIEIIPDGMLVQISLWESDGSPNGLTGCVSGDRFGKEKLSQYINLLQQIHDQMEG